MAGASISATIAAANAPIISLRTLIVLAATSAVDSRK